MSDCARGPVNNPNREKLRSRFCSLPYRKSAGVIALFEESGEPESGLLELTLSALRWVHHRWVLNCSPVRLPSSVVRGPGSAPGFACSAHGHWHL